MPIEKDVVKAWMNFEERVDKMVRPLPSRAPTYPRGACESEYIVSSPEPHVRRMPLCLLMMICVCGVQGRIAGRALKESTARFVQEFEMDAYFDQRHSMNQNRGDGTPLLHIH